MSNKQNEYVLNPEDYGFHPSVNYPEIHDFFGSNTFVKCIGEGGADLHYWYIAIQASNLFGGSAFYKYSIYGGAFAKGKKIEKRSWPNEKFCGLISNKNFAEDLLKHLLGTTTVVSVENEGKERLHMKCLYK